MGRLIVCGWAVLAAGCTMYSLGYRYDEPREAQIEAAGASRLEIHVAEGSLRVVGHEEQTTVSVQGVARASYQDELAQIDMSLEREGDRLVLRALMPAFHEGQVALDLDVTLPDGMSVRIEDGSGSIECRNLGALSVADGSGSVEVSHIEGDVRIEDGSGSIGVQHVNGALLIDDGSGGIDVSHVRGEVVISDGSGSLDVEHVEGSVRIEEDGSGGITITHVTGDVYVSDGSGSIYVRQVGGSFTVARDGSGRLEYRDIAGPVSVPGDT